MCNDYINRDGWSDADNPETTSAMLSSAEDDDPVQKLRHSNAYSLINDIFPPCPSSPRAFEFYGKFSTIDQLLQYRYTGNYDRHENQNENDTHSDGQNEIDAQNDSNDTGQNNDDNAESPDAIATGTNIPGTCTSTCTSTSTPSYRDAWIEEAGFV